MNIFEVLKTFEKEIKEVKPGKIIESKCPKCSGKVQLSRNESNGHLWIKCENDCIKIMQ